MDTPDTMRAIKKMYYCKFNNKINYQLSPDRFKRIENAQSLNPFSLGSRGPQLGMMTCARTGQSSDEPLNTYLRKHSKDIEL